MTANEWDNYADDWDSNEDVRIYAQRAFDSWEQKVAPLYPSLSECKVLDFGCGTGLLTEKLATRCGQIVAIDTSEKMIEALRSKLTQLGSDNVVTSKVALNAESIRANPVLLDSFDLIVASSVCSFLPDYESTVRDLSSVMRPGAYFVQWDWMEDMPKEKVRNAFAAAGLVNHAVDHAFTMSADGESMPVVMGIGRKQS
jgi:2-polyprenyl-3-methyl-5-hydroxy-6-metoxy-1,4-benzoquinol methylase